MKLLEGLKRKVDGQESRDRAYEAVYAALRRGEPVKGQVTGVEVDEVLGESLVVGLEGGKVRGLVPAGEVGEHPWHRLSSLVGQEVVCAVTAVDRQRGVAVLSRKQAQEKAAAETWEVLRQHEAAMAAAREAVEAARAQVKAARSGGKEALLEAVDAVRAAEERWRSVGPVMEGVVRWVGQYRALVDIGGVLAILPRSEVQHGGRVDCREHLRPGDGIQVRVLLVDRAAGNKVYVSRRAVLPDPWQEVKKRFQEGGLYLGTVVRVWQDDVIVELEPGVAVHVDRYLIGPREGAKVVVLVRRIRPASHWIGGRMVRVVEEPEQDGGEAVSQG